MDERIDILTNSGKFTGKTAMKSEAHRNGLFHNTVHIWFFTKEGEILLQKRAKNKLVFPSLWDVSVAGHIGAGEDIRESAVREVQEEIGLKISIEDLNRIGVFKSVQEHSKTLIDCEFHHTFIARLKTNISQLVKQDAEVEDLKLWTINNFIKDIRDPKKALGIVPHTVAYFDTIISNIKKLI